ncbi:OmpL47-type beta-barrel domain-containing protein [Gottfriedia acidiceleris]|uniref:OmpL47-type beta-barrel domain-containing protein n=1 Tax=Gottfriedia acidiceleris TaxID=371036 RepID=UPI003F4CE573
MYYSVDDDAKQMGTSVVLSEEGVHKLVNWSVDKAGNVQRAHTVSFSIDKTAPSIVVSVPGHALSIACRTNWQTTI